MAKMDKLHRIQIPQSLLEMTELSDKVGIFWDPDERAIYLSNQFNNPNEYCIFVRTIDSKNRIIIPYSVLELINANYDSLFVVALKNNRLYIIKVD